MFRILLAIASFICLIFLLITDLDLSQRWLLNGVIVFTALSNWERN